MKTFSLLSLFAIFQTASGCGFSIGLDGGNCPAGTPASDNIARRVIYDAMIEGIASVTDLDASEIISRGEFLSQNGNSEIVGYEDTRRALSVISGQDQKERDLQGQCDITSKDCVWSWCCLICGFCNRRRELGEGEIDQLSLMQEASRISGRSLDAIEDAVCALVKDQIENGTGTGCLKGATVEHCVFEVDEATRKDNEGVESTNEEESSSSILALTVPALLGVAGLMA